MKKTLSDKFVAGSTATKQSENCFVSKLTGAAEGHTDDGNSRGPNECRQSYRDHACAHLEDSDACWSDSLSVGQKARNHIGLGYDHLADAILATPPQSQQILVQVFRLGWLPASSRYGPRLCPRHMPHVVSYDVFRPQCQHKCVCFRNDRSDNRLEHVRTRMYSPNSWAVVRAKHVILDLPAHLILVSANDAAYMRNPDLPHRDTFCKRQLQVYRESTTCDDSLVFSSKFAAYLP